MEWDDIYCEVEDITKDLTEVDEVSMSDNQEITEALHKKFKSDYKEMGRDDVIKAVKEHYRKQGTELTTI